MQLAVLKEWIDKVGQACAIGLALAIPLSTALTYALAVLIVVCWALGGRWSLKSEITFTHPLIMPWMYALLLFSLVGIIYSAGASADIWERIRDVIRLALIPMLLYFYRPAANARLAVAYFVAAMALTGLCAVLKVYGHLPIGLKYPLGAVFRDPMKTSFFMSMAIFFVLLSTPKTRSYRFLKWGLVGFFVYYLVFMNVGKIGYLTLVVCLGYLGWRRYRFKSLLSALVCIPLLGLSFTSPLLSPYIPALKTDIVEETIEGPQASLWGFAQTSLNLIREQLWLGAGTGSFKNVYSTYMQSHVSEDILSSAQSHNEYLRVGVELGIIGLALLLCLFHRQWQLASGLVGKYQIGMRGSLLAFMIGCLGNSWLIDFSESFFYCLITAICFSKMPAIPSYVPVRAVFH